MNPKEPKSAPSGHPSYGDRNLVCSCPSVEEVCEG